MWDVDPYPLELYLMLYNSLEVFHNKNLKSHGAKWIEFYGFLKVNYYYYKN